MLRNASFRVTCAIAALTSLSLLCITCGGSSHSLSQAQAQAISQELFTALNSAMVAGLTPTGTRTAATPPSMGGILERARSAIVWMHRHEQRRVVQHSDDVPGSLS